MAERSEAEKREAKLSVKISRYYFIFYFNISVNPCGVCDRLTVFFIFA